jgi:hypothetical protein
MRTSDDDRFRVLLEEKQRLEEDSKESTLKQIELQQNLADLRKEHSALTETVSGLTRLLSTQSQDFENLKTEHASCSDLIDNLRKQIASMQQVCDESLATELETQKKAMAERLETERKKIAEEKDQLANLIAVLEKRHNEELRSTQDALKAADIIIDQNEDQQNQLRKQIADLCTQLKELPTLKQQLDKARSDLKDSKERQHKLEDDIVELSAELAFLRAASEGEMRTEEMNVLQDKLFAEQMRNAKLRHELSCLANGRSATQDLEESCELDVSIFSNEASSAQVRRPPSPVSSSSTPSRIPISPECDAKQKTDGLFRLGGVLPVLASGRFPIPIIESTMDGKTLDPKCLELLRTIKELMTGDLLASHRPVIHDSEMRGTTIGMNLTTANGRCIVNNVLVGGPAFNSQKISEGDTLVSIDGEKIETHTLKPLLKGDDVVGSACLVTVKKTDGAVETVTVQRMDLALLMHKRKMDELFYKLRERSQQRRDSDSVSLVTECIDIWSKTMLEQNEFEHKCKDNIDAMRTECLALLEGLEALLQATLA